MPTISVVVPCYNGGKFLDQLQACLARQTFRDFEIVVVDDGSTDSLTKAKFALLEPGIRVIHQENRGLPAARNAGILESSADVLMILDCDDQLEPTYFEECLDALRSAPPEVGFVYTQDRLIGARQGVMRRDSTAFNLLSRNMLGYAMLIHRTAWQKVGGYDESMRDGYEDWDFSLRLIGAGYRGIEVPKPLFIYHVSSQGMLVGHSSRRHAALWRKIRNKHRDLYRISNLVRLFMEARAARGETSPFRVFGALLLTSVLPDSWFNALVFSIRSRRLSGSDRLEDSTARRAAIRSGV